MRGPNPLELAGKSVWVFHRGFRGPGYEAPWSSPGCAGQTSSSALDFSCPFDYQRDELCLFFLPSTVVQDG